MPWSENRKPQKYKRETVMQMPVEPPADPEPAPAIEGMDGKTRSRDYLRTSLGLPPVRAATRQDTVPWEPLEEWEPGVVP